jgi:hypothetical protein
VASLLPGQVTRLRPGGLVFARVLFREQFQVSGFRSQVELEELFSSSCF